MNTKNSALSRRDFLKNASLASGLLILPTGFLRGENAPSNRLNVAAIGVAGQGRSDTNGVAGAGANIFALCDVDSKRLAEANKKHPNAKAFADYRELFDKHEKDIDAVIVSTPDHTHFTVAYTAVQLGKHVYVQKPLCHTIDQVRRLTAASIEKKVITQMGNQGQSSPHIRKAKEWYEAGLLGDVSLVEAWTDRPGGWWPQGQKSYLPTEKTPGNLNWDLWLGPVSERPYSPGLAPFTWRGYYEFGCGALGDMAIHLINDAFYVLDLTAPTKIEVEVADKSDVAFPTKSTVAFHFPANDKRGPVKVVWRDGKLKPATPAGADGLPDNGSLLHGKNFVLSLCGWSGTFAPILPAEQRKALDAKAPKEKYPRIKGGHYRNWVDAIRNGTQASSHFGYSGPFAEIILLGVIAERLGRTLNWDAKAGQFIGDDEANRLVKAAPARQGFLA
ncbi:MAG: Gfo/Idh/MocA family oxidoreductase [Puniceicoccales bacterium]|jgi:predicted dehydrogenase|nr:Gfo/Idh/MocA family oxidoreductase [Puniceicoccales bacterium]